MIPFNKPYITGQEIKYIEEAVQTGKISGNGLFTRKCQLFLEKKYGFAKTLLTTSCTDALEMCAMLLEIRPGDEVIIPSYTFVSTALAFVRQGAHIVFCDSRSERPGIDEDLIEELITPKTKVIIPVHYAGVACNMTKIMSLAKEYNLFVVEDAAHSFDSYFIDFHGNKRALGSIGHLAAFSFHETKNIQCGEGGLLAINDERFFNRSEIIWEKGTNRAEFFRGEVNRYGWIDLGSSFLPSEISAAFLWGQLEKSIEIQEKRKVLWRAYYEGLKDYASNNGIKLPEIPSYATNNAHLFYLIFRKTECRTEVIEKLKNNDILSVFHYLSLHNSPFYNPRHDGRMLINADAYSDCLLRLPLFYELSIDDVNKIIRCIIE
jgi:dTDP-4-amino-4,6-dideoxygalactose transaminase